MPPGQAQFPQPHQPHWAPAYMQQHYPRGSMGENANAPLPNSDFG